MLAVYRHYLHREKAAAHLQLYLFIVYYFKGVDEILALEAYLHNRACDVGFHLIIEFTHIARAGELYLAVLEMAADRCGNFIGNNEQRTFKAGDKIFSVDLDLCCEVLGDCALVGVELTLQKP